MKNILIVSTIISVVALALLINHLIHNANNPKSSFLATPEEIAGLINKNENQIAGFFYDKNIERSTSSSNIIYGKDFGEGKIFIYKNKPLTMFYDFINRKQYEDFFNEVKITGTKITYTDSTGTYPAYKIKNCVFVKPEYSPSRNYYTEIFSVSRSKPIAKAELIKVSDSLDTIQRDSASSNKLLYPPVVYIAVNHASLYKKTNNAFDLQGDGLSKDTKLKVIKAEMGYLYCDYIGNYGEPKTAWISTDDITSKKPNKPKVKEVDAEDIIYLTLGDEIKPVKPKPKKDDPDEIKPVKQKKQKYEELKLN